MNHSVHNKLVSFIWSIADDCLRDVYVRGKYRDVILPMVVLRRLDALLEDTKEAVLKEVEFQKNDMKFTEWDDKGMTDAAGYTFYNTSVWTLKKICSNSTNSEQILVGNFEEYLNGYSQNVQEIINKFDLRKQIQHMASKNILLQVLERFTSPDINLTAFDTVDSKGEKLPALTNLGMGYVFEELIRKFNEENNEEAGEHYTPREVINLMTHLVFDPIKNQIPSVITIYDPACGTGGMLTESENFIKDPEGEICADTDVFLYGKEINDETYAICKADILIKGKNPEHIKVGSTLATDEFSSMKFDFMLSNPPYGKSWSIDENYIRDGKTVIDSRFKVNLADYWGKISECDAIPRTSDGQLLFLMEMVDKMKDPKHNHIGSRIASVHNGSSLFTGDAGSGESNIRRYVIENDILDTIIQLPNNLFYNTGITTYIWLLNNNKPEHRKGKVQLIDANELYAKLRKNLGNKNCELGQEHIAQILDCYTQMREQEREGEHLLASKIFDNQDFGYYKVAIVRPDRKKVQFTADNILPLRFDKSLFEPMQFLYEQFGDEVYSDKLATFSDDLTKWADDNGYTLNNKNKAKILNSETWQKALVKLKTAEILFDEFGDEIFMDFNEFVKKADKALKEKQIKLSASDKKALYQAVSVYDEMAEKVIDKIQTFEPSELAKLLEKLGTTAENLPDFGYYPTKPNEFVRYETNSDLNDSENIPLNQAIHDYFVAEVKPHMSEAWIDLDSVKIGYEISFNKYFYQHKTLRTLAEIKADILTLEQQADGLISEILE